MSDTSTGNHNGAGWYEIRLKGPPRLPMGRLVRRAEPQPTYQAAGV